MIDQFFDNFMKTDFGRDLLVDIPESRRELVRKKMYASFCAGAESGMTMLSISHINQLNDTEKKIIVDFFKSEIVGISIPHTNFPGKKKILRIAKSKK